MKHQTATQESAHYDANADTKLVKAAYDFNVAIASKLVAPSIASSNGRGSGNGGSGGSGGRI